MTKSRTHSSRKGRTNLSVSATAQVLQELDEAVKLSPVDTSRSGVALAAIRAGLPLVRAQLLRASEAVVPTET